MEYSPNIARIGTLLGDNTRARMLSTLMHGKALTASELARDAGVTAQTASTHLAKLESGGLLALRKQGRHKYFTIANEEVATLLESMMGLTTRDNSQILATGPRDSNLRKARVCYNHLAGGKSVQLYDYLLAKQYLLEVNGTPELSEQGENFVKSFGIDLDLLQKSKSPLCKACLDWSERRSHLAGSLGRAFLAKFESMRWLSRGEGRIVTFSTKGRREFDAMFGD